MSEPGPLLTWAAFLILAAITLGSALLVVTLRNLFHSVLALVLSLLGVAGLYVLLSAGFLAVIQVLIYVGAIATLFIFVIMLTLRIDDRAIRQTNEQVLAGIVVCVAALALMLAALLTAPWRQLATPSPAPGVETLGSDLLTTYLLPFEVISLLLIAALVGAVTLARREDTKP
jgi:NADH:ubiquinone oxidoreductase subunit 6 (subunit J)